MAEIQQYDRRVIEGGETIATQETNLQALDGKPRTFWSVKIPLKDQEGSIYGLCGTSTDITARKLAEDEREKLQSQLQQASKMESLGSLAGGVAHDMNNVLGAILGMAELCIEDQPKGSQGYRSLDTIMRAAERGGKMVQSLLRFARQSSVEFQELEVNTILREEVHLLEREHVGVESGAGLPELVGIDRPAAAAYALISPAGAGLGVASFLRNDPANGVVEVGSIVFATVLQRTTAATEALILMARHALGTLGYRRYEWKCDSANAPSIAAARRLGFTYEGRFRQAVVYSGRNRDTDWFSIIDSEWPAISAAYDAWLAPGNFDPAGRQRTRLEDCLAQVGRTPGAPPPPA